MKLSIDTALPKKASTVALADALRISRREATGLLFDLWAWALTKHDGEIPWTIEPATVADAVGWYRNDPGLLGVLIACRVLAAKPDDPTVLEFDGFMALNGYAIRERRRKRGKPDLRVTLPPPTSDPGPPPVEASRYAPAPQEDPPIPGEQSIRELAVKLLKLAGVRDLKHDTLTDHVHHVLSRKDVARMPPFAVAKLVVDGYREATR